MKLNIYALIIISSSLNGCAWLSGSPDTTNIKIPKQQAKPIPGGNLINWRYLGTTTDGQLVDEINESSIIKSQESQIYLYQDRKTVVNPNQFSSYTNGQPHYKYVLSNWQIDCTNQQYLITSAEIYNDVGLQLQIYDYKNNNDVRWLRFGSGSIAELQYNYICLNQNRNLGY